MHYSSTAYWWLHIDTYVFSPNKLPHVFGILTFCTLVLTNTIQNMLQKMYEINYCIYYNVFKWFSRILSGRLGSFVKWRYILEYHLIKSGSSQILFQKLYLKKEEGKFRWQGFNIYILALFVFVFAWFWQWWWDSRGRWSSETTTNQKSWELSDTASTLPFWGPASFHLWSTTLPYEKFPSVRQSIVFHFWQAEWSDIQIYNPIWKLDFRMSAKKLYIWPE